MLLEFMACRGMTDVAEGIVGAQMSRAMNAVLKGLAFTQRAMGIQQQCLAGQ